MINLARGIVERVFYVSHDGGLARPPQPKPGVFTRLSTIRQKLLRCMRPTTVVMREDYPALYAGRKRAVYQRAFDSLCVRAINVRDAWVSTFVKAEKVNFSKKSDPAPRVIQPRSPRYNLEVGRYLKLFERELCNGFKRVFGYCVIVKGKNADEVGEVFESHWSRYRQPVAIGLDATRFDQHVSRAALEWEHSIYNGVFNSSELRGLLRWQLKNRGIGRSGGQRVDYEIEGCRMSGDINTGMGNCLLMSSMILSYIQDRGLDARLANNGDDCVIICENRDLSKFDGLPSYMLDFGFQVVVEEPVHELEQIVFCQAQPVRIGGSYRMVRDPRTAMSKDCVSLKSWATPVEFAYWANAISGCGLSLTRGVPMWEAWYASLATLGAAAPVGVVADVWDSGLGYMARGVRACEVDDEARYSFYLAFGITPDEQCAMEDVYRMPVSLCQPTPMRSCESQTLDAQNPLTQWLKLHP